MEHHHGGGHGRELASPIRPNFVLMALHDPKRPLAILARKRGNKTSSPRPLTPSFPHKLTVHIIHKICCARVQQILGSAIHYFSFYFKSTLICCSCKNLANLSRSRIYSGAPPCRCHLLLQHFKSTPEATSKTSVPSPSRDTASTTPSSLSFLAKLRCNPVCFGLISSSICGL